MISQPSLFPVPSTSQTSLSTSSGFGLQLIRDVMTKGKAAGFNLIRAWATSASPYYALQTSPGNFSEPIFRGLDYALDQARQQSLKVRS